MDRVCVCVTVCVCVCEHMSLCVCDHMSGCVCYMCVCELVESGQTTNLFDDGETTVNQ